MKVWVDRTDIEPAADWSERISRGIEAAKAFIFVITQNRWSPDNASANWRWLFSVTSSSFP